MSGCPFPHMPADWVPPAPAWKSDLGGETIIVSHLGSQTNGGEATGLEALLAGRLGHADAPRRIEAAIYRDTRGYANRLTLAYWSDADARARWLADIDAWLTEDARLAEPAGYWREDYTLPASHFEAMWSSLEPYPVGVRELAPVVGPIPEHGYWGGARDRIMVSRENRLASSLGEEIGAIRFGETRGRRLAIAAPQYLCVIRSGQDWTACTSEERDDYLNDVAPTLALGMAYLAGHPLETGCIDCRFAQQLGPDGIAIERSFGLAQFLSLGHLERWAKSHPTHLAILSTFYKMLEQHHGSLDLRLYHEVFVVPDGGADFIYVNCHNRTGLLTLDLA